MAGMSRREFGRLLGLGVAAGLTPGMLRDTSAAENLYEVVAFGNVRLLHFADCHAQLLPIYYREPNVNLGIGPANGRAPHLVGEALLAEFGLGRGTPEAHAFTHLGFAEAAAKFGKVGGFAHLAALVKKLRGEVAPGASLLLDSGDTWQGSGTALWTRGQDMVETTNLLGVDVMTGHWEFTYLEAEIRKNIETFKGEFVAQNVRVKEDALFDGAKAYDEDSGHALKPYTTRFVGGRWIAVVGQSFPYTPIANPQRFIPDWTFGINDEDLQLLVDELRDTEKPDAVILLSHNGMDADLKLASRVAGIDAILGGHTHDAVPQMSVVKNPGGKTLVGNSGSNGKFLSVLDLDVGGDGVKGYRYRLLPVFSNLLPADAEMQSLVEKIREPHLPKLREVLAVADALLYRRGNFNGTFDQVICDALREVGDAQIALSPGFRWGTSVLPGEAITMEHVLDQTATTYPETYVRDMSGADLKLILEDVCDNLFNPDPYFQQGGDMVRLGGLDYVCAPKESIGSRITNMQLDDGTPIQADKMYKVAGWATVGSKSEGPPVWEVVAQYMRSKKSIKLNKLNTPKLVGISGNAGIAVG